MNNSAVVRFSVLALLFLGMVGGASAEETYSSSISDPGNHHNSFSYELTADIDMKLSNFCAGMMRASSPFGPYNRCIDRDDENIDDTEYVSGSLPITIKSGDIVTFKGTDYSSSQNELNVEVNGVNKYSKRFDFGLIDADGFGDATWDSTAYNGLSGYFNNIPFNSGETIKGFSSVTLITNQPPQFNSTSVNPDPPLIGESVSYGAEVYDSDGSVDYTNLTLEYGGSTVVVDEQRTGTTSPVWNDVFTPQTGDKWLNATLEVVDDAGAVTSTEINRFLSDDAASVSISNLDNQTYYSYSRDATVTVTGSDSNPDEDITCSLYLDSNQYDTRTVTEGNSFTTSVESGVGGHTFKASCSDPAGNTNTKKVDYTVDSAKVVNVGSVSQAYETENRTYELDLKTGDMVNSADINFVYDGTTQESKSIDSNGVETLTPDFYYEVPLVSSNQTNKNWKVNYDLNISDFQSATTSTLTESTSSQNQEVLWSYYIENSDTDPANGKYIETEDLKHDVKIHTETKKAELDGITTYNRDSTTDTMSVETNTSDYTTLRGVLDVGLAETFNQSSFTTESSVDVSFKGDSRSLSTGTDTVEVYKIRITDGSTGLDTSEALVFDVDYEEEGNNTKTRLTMDLSVWKNKDEKIRRYQFKEAPAKEHSFNIYPSWAEYKIRTLPYPDQRKFDLIQYFNQDTNKVRRSYFFPTVQKISNSTTTVPLKTINQSEAAPIDFEITNSDGDPAQNVYCRVDRKFGGGDFETVFQIKTGSQGKSQSFAEINEIYYGFTCYKNGEVADQFAAQIMQNPMRLQLGGGTEETSLDYFDRFDASCTSNTTRLECDYQSQTEKLRQATLTVDRNEVKQDVTVCSKNSPTATGKLVCKGLNTTANSYNYELTGQFPQASVTGETGFLGTQDRPFPAAGLFMTAILFMLTTAATAFDLRVGIASGALVFILTSLIEWITLNPSQEATLIGMAIIAGVAVSQ